MIIVNAVIHDAVHRKPFEGAIRVEAGKIKKVGKIKPQPGEEVIDAGGLNVYPGLVEAHSHIGLASYAVRAPIGNPLTFRNISTAATASKSAAADVESIMRRREAVRARLVFIFQFYHKKLYGSICAADAEGAILYLQNRSCGYKMYK